MKAAWVARYWESEICKTIVVVGGCSKMGYPIFLFYDDDDFIVFDSGEEHCSYLEQDSLKYIGMILDSEGRLLTASDGKDRVEISDSGAEPDPERLRQMLIKVLRRKGQEWGTDAPLARLITAAQEACRVGVGGIPVGKAIANLLRRLRLRKAKS